jgi:hypothetical protein
MMLLWIIIFLFASTATTTPLTTTISTATPTLIIYNGHNMFDSSVMNNSVSHEYMLLLSVLGGLANRHEPQFFLNSTKQSSYWYNIISNEIGWLSNHTIINYNNIEDIIKYFQKKKVFSGIILYDSNVPSTSNIAATLCGMKNMLPILNNGILYQLLVQNGPMLHIKMSLVDKFNGSITGSIKNDVYEWFRIKYMTNKTNNYNPLVMGYLMDYWWGMHSPNTNSIKLSSAIVNMDYIVAKRGLIFDLDVWEDTIPNDDTSTNETGLDYITLNKLMLTAYNRVNGSSMIHVIGFVPWSFKYLTPKHGGVASEWQCSKILSSYNAYIDADACCDINTMSNAALYSHYKLKKSYKQNPVPTISDLINDGYVNKTTMKVIPNNYLSFYVGDYDSAAWTYNKLYEFWLNVDRGQIPLGWAINPTNSIRFPIIFDLIYNSLTTNDRIITGDSGAGYINPTQILAPRLISNLSSGQNVWVQHNTYYYNKFDIVFTGFLINGACGKMTNDAEKMYSSFSPFGAIEQTGYAPADGKKGTHLTNDTNGTKRMPIFQEMDLDSNATIASNTIINRGYEKNEPTFHAYRSILRSPTYHYNLVQNLLQNSSKFIVLDPLKLSVLAKLYLSQ